MRDERKSALEVQPVKTRKQWKCFHALPRRIQSADPAWIPPLRLQMRQMWAPRHPFFRHVSASAWLALRNGEAVGRVSAQVDRLDAECGRPATGHFGQLEAIDDPAVFECLLAAAERWLVGRGMSEVTGPFDLSINQQCGLLVDGFEYSPMMMMAHNPPYYPRQLEALGFEPVVETLAYRGSSHYVLPARIERLLARMHGRLEVRPVARARLALHAEQMRQIFNAAWADNWGFVPFTEGEFAHMVGEMKLLVRPGYVSIAEVDGEAAGFIVALPDLNELIADLDGRLFPLGAARLLWRIARRRSRRARIPLMGVLPKYQQSLTGAAISYALIEAIKPAVVEDGIEIAEQSWILADNRGMRSIVESIDMQVAQRFNIYRKRLAG